MRPPCDSLLSAFMRKKSRLFALAEALRARRTGITAQELADRFGVTLRTIYRDLEALQDAGMPIKADRGRGGGYALDKNYQLPPINWLAASGRVDGDVHGLVRAEARDNEAAQNLRDVVRGFLALAKIQSARTPGLTSMLNTVELGGEAHEHDAIPDRRDQVE